MVMTGATKRGYLVGPRGAPCGHRTAFTTLNIVVLTAIPIAMENTTTAVNPGDRVNARTAYRRSCIKLCIRRL